MCKIFERLIRSIERGFWSWLFDIYYGCPASNKARKLQTKYIEVNKDRM